MTFKEYLTFIDFFSGIGGIRLGLEQTGFFKCIGFCEYDKFARQSYKSMYNTEGEWENHDIRTVKSGDLPRADLWAFGFPCQDISVAGKGRSFYAKNEQTGEYEQTRSGLFFEIIRLLAGLRKEDRPKWLLCENVKNLLSIDAGIGVKGSGFLRVLLELDALGYDAEWQLLNSKDWGVPQNRERVFLVGRIRGTSGRKVFPIRPTNGENTTKLSQVEGSGKIEVLGNYNASNYSASRIVSPNGVAPTVMENHGTVTATVVKAVLTPEREEKRQNGRRMKAAGEPMFTLTAQDRHGVAITMSRKNGIKETDVANTLLARSPLTCLGNSTPITAVLKKRT